MKKSSKTKKGSVKHTIFELPSSNLEMENYIQKNREVLMESVANAIGYAVERNLAGIEVFKFDKSNYIVLIGKKDYVENLNHIFDCSMATENYELCGKVNSIKKLISSPKFFKELKSVKLI